MLETAGKRTDVNISFHQSTKSSYVFAGSMTADVANTESLEVIVNVTDANTVGFRIYPHYRGGYINLSKARDQAGLMRRLLLLSDQNFLYWGADDVGDVFSGYTVTLESSFPSEAIVVVLRSIANIDKYVGQLRPFYDGSPAV